MAVILPENTIGRDQACMYLPHIREDREACKYFIMQLSEVANQKHQEEKEEEEKKKQTSNHRVKDLKSIKT